MLGRNTPAATAAVWRSRAAFHAQSVPIAPVASVLSVRPFSSSSTPERTRYVSSKMASCLYPLMRKACMVCDRNVKWQAGIVKRAWASHSHTKSALTHTHSSGSNDSRQLRWRRPQFDRRDRLDAETEAFTPGNVAMSKTLRRLEQMDTYGARPEKMEEAYGRWVAVSRSLCCVGMPSRGEMGEIGRSAWQVGGSRSLLLRGVAICGLLQCLCEWACVE